MATASASLEERVASVEERLIELFPPIESMFDEPEICDDCGACLCPECVACTDGVCCAEADRGEDIAEHTMEGVIQALETLKIVAASGTEPEAVAASQALLGWYQTLATTQKALATTQKA